MAYKILKIFLIFIKLILLVNKVVNGQKFIPEPRYGHTAIFLGGKIYYMGGEVEGKPNATRDFFYLNLGKNWSWVNLESQGVILPATSYHSTIIGGANQDSIFIMGGAQSETTSLIYLFDIKTSAITAPIAQRKVPPRRVDMSTVTYAGKIYMLGGQVTNNDRTTLFNNFDILDTVNITWHIGSLVNASAHRIWYTATLVNEVIYYIGGQQNEGQDFTSMDNIYQYDINSNTWTLKMAKVVKYLPEKRIGHSAVLVNDKIYIYGGEFFPQGAQRPILSTDQIAMLDINTFVWSIPELDPPNIPGIAYHTATLIDNIMLISFGNITSYPGGDVYNDKFYLFNISKEPKITWNSFTAQELVNIKDPQSIPLPATPSNTKAEVPSKTVAVALSSIVGGLIGVCLISAAMFFSYKYYKRRENKQGFTKHAVDHF